MPTTADLPIDTLIAWDVDVVFGLPGDGVNGIFESLRKRQDRIRFEGDTRSRRPSWPRPMPSGRGSSAYASPLPGPAAALVDGPLRCQARPGAGAGDHRDAVHDLIETFTQQDIDLTRVFNDVTAYNAHVSDPAHAESVTSLACRTALAQRAGDQGLARQGCLARRSSLHDRRHRTARDTAVTASDGAVRRTADRRLFLPLHRVLPSAGEGPWRAGRPRRPADRSALSGGGRARW